MSICMVYWQDPVQPCCVGIMVTVMGGETGSCWGGCLMRTHLLQYVTTGNVHSDDQVPGWGFNIDFVHQQDCSGRALRTGWCTSLVRILISHALSSSDWMAQGEAVWWGEPGQIVTGSGFQCISVTALCTSIEEDKQPRLTLKPVQTGSGRICLQLGSPDKAQLHSICVENGCI